MIPCIFECPFSSKKGPNSKNLIKMQSLNKQEKFKNLCFASGKHMNECCFILH